MNLEALLLYFRGKLTVRADVPVYKTLVLRLKRKGTD